MASHLFSVKPLSEPMPAIRLLVDWPNFFKFESKLSNFPTRKLIWKCHLQSENFKLLKIGHCEGIHWWPVDSPHKAPVIWKVFSCHAIIMHAHAHLPFRNSNISQNNVFEFDIHFHMKHIAHIFDIPYYTRFWYFLCFSFKYITILQIHFSPDNLTNINISKPLT